MSTNQGGLTHTNKTNHTLGGETSSDSTTSLSTSDYNRLSSTFSQAPQFKETPTTLLNGIEFPIDQIGYRGTYATYVMNGKNNLYKSHFGGPTVHMDYHLNEPPIIGDSANPVQPTDSPAAGQTDSSIVITGLGPNVSVFGGPVVDASPNSTPPFTQSDTKNNPKNSSTDISNGDLKGDGFLGKSPASST